MKLIDSYLLRHLVLPFTVAVLVFVVIMLAEVAWHVSGILVGTAASARLLAQFFLFSAPRCVVWSMPVGVLVSVAMATVALQRAGELTALRAGGASLRRIYWPWIAAGALLSALAVLLNQEVVPYTTAKAQEAFRKLTFQAPVVKQSFNEFFRSPDGRLFYVKKMDAATGTLEGITIWVLDSTGRIRRLICARSASAVGRKWLLRDGWVRDFDQFGTPQGPPRRFSTLETNLWSAIQQYYADKRTPYEMSITELRQLAEMLEAGGKDAHRLLVHLHFKYSIPCACFVFALLAAPLARRYAHVGGFIGLVIAIVVLFLYNGVRSWTLALGLAGALPPAIAGWLPNAIFSAVGLAFLAAER